MYLNLAEAESVLYKLWSKKQMMLLFPGACNHLNGWEIRKLFMPFKILIIFFLPETKLRQQLHSF
jgi:hypothetical protein